MEDQELEQQEQQEEQQEERRFTQAEVDAIVNKRYAKWKKDQPSEEELAEFNEWKKSKQPKDDTTELKEALEELETLRTEREIDKRERFVERMGITDEIEVSVYVSKIMKGQKDPGDFDEFKTVAKEFLKEHKPKGIRVDLGARMNGNGGGKKTTNETMNDLLRAARG